MSRAISCAPFPGSTKYGIQVGWKVLAKSSRRGSMSVTTIGCAPEARVAARANVPAPQMSALCPRARDACSIPCITTDRGSMSAAWAYVRLPGILCVCLVSFSLSTKS
jgi:hypothetical protein